MSESMNFPTVTDPDCEFTVTTAAVPSDGGTLTGAGEYSMSESATVVATPALPTSIDVGVDLVFIADETSSGADIRVLFNNVLAGLDSALRAAGIGSGTVANKYALVGFGSVGTGTHGATNNVAHTHFALGDFAGLLAVVDDIATNPSGGSVEDTYEALSYAASEIAWRDNSAVTRIVICMSDEDRNQHLYTAGGATQTAQFAAIKDELVAARIHYVALGSWCGILDGEDEQIMGYSLVPDKTWKADGAGGYTNGTGGYAGSGFQEFPPNTDSTFPTGIIEETLELALHPDLNGSFWDFQFFRVGIGTCSTNGTAVTRISGNGFPFAGAVNGGDININGVDYVINVVGGNDNLSLTTSAGVQAAADWIVPRDERDSFFSALTASLVETATQNLLWQFDGWYDELGVRVSTSLSYTFRVDGDRALEARFVFETG